MYNLGNTCYQSAVLQCLIACVRVQEFFLYYIMHHHVACHELRRAEGGPQRPKATVDNKSGSSTVEDCLACELDKLMLRYFGNSRGVNILSAVSNEQTIQMTDNIKPAVPGEPIITSDMLSCAWQCGSMSHLAGYDQRDAHEFLHGFLESLSKSDHAYRNRVTRAVSLAQPFKSPGVLERPPSTYKGMLQ